MGLEGLIEQRFAEVTTPVVPEVAEPVTSPQLESVAASIAAAKLAARELLS